MGITILTDIFIIFALSTFVNFIFTKIRIPTLIGYMLTGIIAGPHLFGIINAEHEIELMAEMGVILLMFTIGLEFSLQHLFKIRKIVFLGGFLQLTLTTLVVMFIGQTYDMNWQSALFIGLLTALSSTAVVLKVLQERSEITSNYGRTVVGILIFQDIILIPLMLFTPLLAGKSSGIGSQLLPVILKTLFLIGLVYAGNKWIMPKVLHLIALTKNQELFLMSILLICVSVALLTSGMGMSLAFGAFLAGLMISESEYSHNAFGNIIPFKDTFSSFFFVSVGMLLDLNFVLENYLLVAATVLLVILAKFVIAAFTAFLLGHTFRGTILVGLALSQVGEFSFILAKTGLDQSILSSYYYQLFLAVAIISMSVSPLLIQAGKPFANFLLKGPVPKFLVNGLFPLKHIEIPELKNHLVLIGTDSRTFNVAVMARHMKIPYISIVFDPESVSKRQQKGETIIYGDAINEPILQAAHINTAEVVVVSVGNMITSMAIIEKIRNLNKHAFIIVRTRHVENIEELHRTGADQVIPEEFETAIELFDRILTKFLFPRKEINMAIAEIREGHYGLIRDKHENLNLPGLNEIPNIEITALNVNEGSFLSGKTPAGLQLRNNYGVSLVALKRGDKLIDHPGPNLVFSANDIAYILGTPVQIAKAIELFSNENGK